MTKKNILTGALILTAAGFVTNILAFRYRIFLSNTLGAEGMGLYHLMISVYMLAWSIVCSGFTTTISKLTAQENGKGQSGNTKRIFTLSLTISLSLGVGIALVLTYVKCQNNSVRTRTQANERLLSNSKPGGGRREIDSACI